jgi:thiosulfate dehydrogenase (quinone) large subunit
MTLPSSRNYGGWLALVRILTGAIWLVHGVPKFLHSDTFMPPGGFFGSYLQRGLAASSGPYHDFLANVVAPNAGVFAELVRLGEVCVGISLVLGLFTRLGGLVGILLPLNYIAARGGLGSFSAWGAIDGCMILLSAINFVLPTGRVAGVDALLPHRVPRRTAVVVPEVVPEPPLRGPTAPP